MWEPLGEAIKVFFEKHLIPTILSLIFGTVILLGTPENFWIIQKISKLGYYLFVSGIFFLIFKFMVKRYEKYHDNKKKKQEEVRKLWEYVDGLRSDDIEVLKEFIANKNNPVITRNIFYCNYETLLCSDYIRKKEYYDDNGCYIKYVLEENFYELLLYSAKKYKKIGRFVEV